MKSIGRFLPLSVLLLVAALPLQAQQGQIRGELYGQDGEPLAGARILLDQIDGGGNRHYELESDNSGLFVHLSVALAAYQVTLELDGRPTAIVELRVGAGENPVRLDLERGEIESYEFSRLLGTTERVVRELTMVGEGEVVSVPGGENPFDNSEERAAAAEASAAMREAFDAGRAALDAGDYDEAIRQFMLANEQSPTPQHVIHANLGVAYDRARRYDEAAASFEEAQAIATADEVPPQETNYYTNITLAYAMAGDLDRANENAEKAAAVDPSAAGMGFYNVGVVLTNAGQGEAARAAFARAVEVDPEMADAHFQLGLSLVGADQIAESVPVFERYLELRPEGADAETARQLLEFAAGQ
jgi:tetratricopeptide (TPR) repeat protein